MLNEEEKRIDGKEIIKTYLLCPYCGEKYTVCFNSYSTLVLAKQICRQIAQLQTIKDVKQYERKSKDIRKKQNRLEREMKILREKYSKEF